MIGNDLHVNGNSSVQDTNAFGNATRVQRSYTAGIKTDLSGPVGGDVWESEPKSSDEEHKKSDSLSSRIGRKFRTAMKCLLIVAALDSGSAVSRLMPDDVESAYPETIENLEGLSYDIHSLGSKGQRFVKSLSANKESLMEDLNLTSEEYDWLADISLKISDNESQVGESAKYSAMNFIESTNIGSSLASLYRSYTKGGSTLSRGMTQYKIADASEKEKALFDKYGITYDNVTNICRPEKSAIATMIHLSTLKDDYSKYLSSMKNIAPDMNDPAVIASIKNAKKILADDNTRADAIEALRAINGSLEERNKLESVHLTKQDLDDLRVYANTIVLPHTAYMAARWTGRSIVPSGIKSDLAAANNLNAAAGVGYIYKVDNSIKTIGQ